MSRVLLVEDNALNRQLVRDLFVHHGMDVHEAGDVDQAIGALACRPDIVLLDIEIPGGGGEAVLRRIRATPDLDAVPVVAVTAFAMAGDEERFLAAGFDAYFSKPLDLGALVRRVTAFLEAGRAVGTSRDG